MLTLFACRFLLAYGLESSWSFKSHARTSELCIVVTNLVDHAIINLRLAQREQLQCHTKDLDAPPAMLFSRMEFF